MVIVVKDPGALGAAEPHLETFWRQLASEPLLVPILACLPRPPQRARTGWIRATLLGDGIALTAAAINQLLRAWRERGVVGGGGSGWGWYYRPAERIELEAAYESFMVHGGGPGFVLPGRQWL